MTELKPIKCVVLPARPPIDKLIAYKRVEMDFRNYHRLRVAFCDVNMPTPKDHERWNAMCTPGSGDAYLLDVGEKKYHNTFAGSAAAVEKLSSETEGGRTWNRLVELANENNRTGKLKQTRHSVAKIIRDVYHVMNGGIDSQEVVFDHGMDVVNGFFFRQNGRNWNDLFTNQQYEALRKLWDGFNVSEKEVLPFTLPLYFRQLFLAGRSPAEILEKVSWWLDKIKRIASRREVAQRKEYAVCTFQIGSKTAGLIHVGDYFDAEAASYRWIGSGELAVGILRNERGHVHIQASFRHKGANFKALAETLERLEPGRWYYETRFSGGPMLMNGSRQYSGVTPTSLSDATLVMLTYQCIEFN